MDEDKDDEDQLSEENKKTRIVKYHQHGILSKTFDFKTHEQGWLFEAQNETKEIKGEVDLVTLLDDLSKEGYELVCSSDGDEYILRTKVEIEENEDHWDID